MSVDQSAVDGLLAAAVRGERPGDPQRSVASSDAAAVVARINYHGISGLLRGAPAAMVGWPDAVTRGVSKEAVAQTMWELRHRQLLNRVLAELAGAKVIAILLKGTALAYDLYPAPASRARGDSDLLIDPSDLGETRRIFERLGLARTGDTDGTEDFSLQEVWSGARGGAIGHHIDLHWQLLNSPALVDLFPFAECAAHRIALPRLGPHAFGMDRPRTLIHTCIHRATNFASPYFVGEHTYYSGDRLIWLHDIHLLAGALSGVEWQLFCDVAKINGVSAACLDGLLAAQRFLATPIPASVRDSLAAAPTRGGPSAYLRARQLGRALQDLKAVPGLGCKLRYFRARVLPSPAFVRDKYPLLAGLPLPLLYARRVFDLVRARPKQGQGQ